MLCCTKTRALSVQLSVDCLRISSSHYAINVRAFWTELIQWYHILCMLHWHLTDMLVANVPVCQYESSCCQWVNHWLVKLLTVMSAYRQFAEWWYWRLQLGICWLYFVASELTIVIGDLNCQRVYSSASWLFGSLACQQHYLLPCYYLFISRMLQLL